MLRLASYNLQKCIGMDLRRNPDRVMKVIDALGTDIVVLQEADKRLAPRPAALPHFMLHESGWDVMDFGGAGSLGWHGNAMVYRPDRVQLDQLGQITLPGVEPRGAIWADMQTALGPLRIAGVHLGLLAASRRAQVQHLAQELGALPPRPTLWAGDFNDWNRGDRLLAPFKDLRFAPVVASFPSPRPVAPLDRIVLPPTLKAARPAPMASDHLPIWAEITQA